MWAILKCLLNCTPDLAPLPVVVGLAPQVDVVPLVLFDTGVGVGPRLVGGDLKGADADPRVQQGQDDQVTLDGHDAFFQLITSQHTLRLFGNSGEVRLQLPHFELIRIPVLHLEAVFCRHCSWDSRCKCNN